MSVGVLDPPIPVMIPLPPRTSSARENRGTFSQQDLKTIKALVLLTWKGLQMRSFHSMP